jgi:hypothetical protein
MIGFLLFILLFFTLPVGIAEGQPLLMVIPMLGLVTALMWKEK